MLLEDHLHEVLALHLNCFIPVSIDITQNVNGYIQVVEGRNHFGATTLQVLLEKEDLSILC